MRYIIGVGNYSMWDDSIGLRMIEYISENNLEDGFQAIDLSGNGINLLNYMQPETEKIVIIDAASVGDHPGNWQLFTPAQVETQKQMAGISSHEGDIIKVLELARQMNYFIPPIVFLGIRPKKLENDFGLSEELKSRQQEYARVAIEEVKK